MFEGIVQFFKRFKKSEKEESKSTAKERLHLVLAQDRANISADFLEMMKQEILEVIKKYIDIDEKAIDVRLTNKESEDGSVGAPALYANIPIITIKNEARKLEGSLNKEDSSEEKEDKQDENVQEAENKNENSEETKNNAEQNKKEEKKEQEEKEEEPKKEESIEPENDEAQDTHKEPDNNNVNEVENEEKNS